MSLRRYAVAWLKKLFGGKPVQPSNPKVIAFVKAQRKKEK